MRCQSSVRRILEINLANYDFLDSSGALRASRSMGAARLGLKGTGLDAAHALDAIAGGYAHNIIGGRSPVQRTIGSLWKNSRQLIRPGRQHRLTAVFE